jgi:hypothetical protein
MPSNSGNESALNIFDSSQWIPSIANKKDKMTYAMWSNNVKMALQGIHSVIQANSIEDLDKEVVLQKVSRFERDEM